MAAVPKVQKKNVAIFDDFISSNNTDEDFDEITATLGDVDDYIEHQLKLQAERGARGGGKRGGKGGRGGKHGDEGDEGKGGEGGRGGRGGEGGRGGRGGGEGGRGGGEGGRGGRGGGEGGRGGRGGGRGGKAGGEGPPPESELRQRFGGSTEAGDDIDKLKKEAQGGARGGKRGGRGGRGGGAGGEGRQGGKGKKGGKMMQGKATVQGVAVMLAGCLCMSSSMTTTKLASKMAPVVQVRFLRSLMTMIISFFYATSYKKKSVSFSKVDNKKGLMMRVGMTVFQTFAQMYVVRKLPLGLSAALMGLSPVTTSILNWLILGSIIPAAQWVCIFTTVVGVFLISQPDIIFNYGSDANSYEEFDVEKYIAIGLAIAMSVCRSLTMILTRKLVMMGEGRSHMSVITFYNSMAATILCILLLPFKGNVGYKLLEIPSLECIALITLGSFVFFGRPVLMEVGGAKLPQSLTAILRSSSIVWAFLFQLVLFGEVPSIMEATGISVIVGCATMMFKLTGSE